jgi:hypothetical protein
MVLSYLERVRHGRTGVCRLRKQRRLGQGARPEGHAFCWSSINICWSTLDPNDIAPVEALFHIGSERWLGSASSKSVRTNLTGTGTFLLDNRTP